MSTAAKKKAWGKLYAKSETQTMVNSNKNMTFCGSGENFIENGRRFLEESISLFHGRINPLRCFSVDELNTVKIDVNPSCILPKESHFVWYKGDWEGMCVLVKVYVDRYMSLRHGTIREIVVATQMSTHKHVHKLIGCCLETKFPVLIYEWVENGSLVERILGDNSSLVRPPLEWTDRLRIAWEIAHAVAYLHTAFRRPIIHRSLKPATVFLDQDKAAKLSDFSLSISLPEGEEYVEDNIIGTYGYVAPEYFRSSRVAPSTDVYSFGVLLLVLFTGKPAVFVPTGDEMATHLVDWVRKGLADDALAKLIDPAIFDDVMVTNAQLQNQLRVSVELAIRCTETEDTRPSMTEVAAELSSMIMASDYISSCNG